MIFRGVNGNGKADACGGSARRVNRGVDADYFAVRIDERAAGIAAIDGRVGLDGFVDESGLAGLHGAAESADHASGQRGLKAEGIAYSQNFLSHLQAGGIAEIQKGQRFTFGIDLDQGYVIALIRANYFCGIARLVAEYHFDALRFLDDVKIGEDVAARIDYKTGARAFDGDGVHEEIVLGGFGEDVGYCGRSLAVDANVDGFVVGEDAVALVAWRNRRGWNCAAWGRVTGRIAAGFRWRDRPDVDGLVRAEARADPVRAKENKQRAEDHTRAGGGVNWWHGRGSTHRVLHVSSIEKSVEQVMRALRNWHAHTLDVQAG